MLVDVYRLAERGEGVLRAWKVFVLLFECFMVVEKFSRVEIRLSVWLVVNLGSALFMQCSCDGGVSACEVTGDLQVDPDVVLKLPYRPARSGITKHFWLLRK